MGAAIRDEVTDEIHRLKRAGAGLDAIAAALKGKVSRAKIAMVLAEARKGSGKRPARPKVPATAPAAQEPAAAPLAPLAPPSPALPPASDPYAAAEQRLVDAWERVMKLLEALDARIAEEIAKTEPDWTFVAKGRGELRHIREDAIRFRPSPATKPSEDPGNVEAARILVGDLRARVEAGLRVAP